jgi:hypothetical protein
LPWEEQPSKHCYLEDSQWLALDTSGGYHAKHFVDALSAYLCSVAPAGTTLPKITEEDRVNVYLQMTALVPGNSQTGKTVQRDCVCTVAAAVSSSGQTLSEEVFETVFIHVAEENTNTARTSLARE